MSETDNKDGDTKIEHLNDDALEGVQGAGERGLLAHEVTHVQQPSGGRKVQSQAGTNPEGVASTAGTNPEGVASSASGNPEG